MKKRIFAMAMLAVTVGTSLVSCTKDENPTTPTKAEVVGKASVTVDLKAETPNSATGKSVNRGSLYAWITKVNITAISKDFNYAPFTTPFDLVTSGGDSSYNLDGVALGHNDFTVLTETNVPSMNISFETTPMTPAARMTMLTTKNPYAIYSASIPNFNVVTGGNTLPSTELKTQHGRACAVFTMATALTNLGVTAKVTATPTSSVPLAGTLPQLTLNAGTNGSFYWSNVASTNGASVLYTVDLYDNNGNKFNTFTTTLNLVASTSVNNQYVISENDITTNTAMDVFTAQPWTDNNGGGTIGN